MAFHVAQLQKYEVSITSGGSRELCSIAGVDSELVVGFLN
jgi:hypothetical protein